MCTVPYFKISEHSVGDDTMCCAVICSSVQHGYFCYWRIYRPVCIILTQHVFLTSPDRQQQQHNRDTGERCLVDTWRTTRFLRITMRHGRQYNGVCVWGENSSNVMCTKLLLIEMLLVTGLTFWGITSICFLTCPTSLIPHSCLSIKYKYALSRFL